MPDQLKKIAFLTPRSGLSDEAFRRYWREVHGPLVAGSPGYCAYRQRYVQNHITGPGPVGGAIAFAGMAEFWLPSDNENDFALTAIYQDRIRIDELNFIDMDKTVSMSAVELVAKPGHGPVKLVVLARRAANLTAADFRCQLAPAYVDAALADPDYGGRIRGWHLNLVVDGSFRLPGGRAASALPIDCIEEIWFDSRADAFAACASEGFLWRVYPLARRLFDARGWQSFMAEERVYFDRGRPVA